MIAWEGAIRALVTRPQHDAKLLVEALVHRGISAFISPMLHITVLTDIGINLSGVQVILFTSSNGVRAFAALTSRRDIPVFAVGDRTAAVAEENGFPQVESAGGDVEKLAVLVEQCCNPNGGVLFHPAGSAVAGDLSGRLERCGFVVRRAVIYEAHQATGFSSEIRKALLDGKVDLVMFFSPRTAKIFVELAISQGLGLACTKLEALCLSDAVAAAAGPIIWRRVMVAPNPTQDSLLATLDNRLVEL